MTKEKIKNRFDQTVRENMNTHHKNQIEIPAEEDLSKGKLSEKRKKLKRDQKSQATRTIFKLRAEEDKFLRMFGNSPGISIRDIIDLAAAEADKADKAGTFPHLLEDEHNGERKSYALSKVSLEILNSLHIKRKITRESALSAGLYLLAKHINKISITKETIIEAAETLIGISEKMLTIYYSEEAVKSREILMDAEEPSYTEINEILGYVETLNELPSLLADFQRRVKR